MSSLSQDEINALNNTSKASSNSESETITYKGDFVGNLTGIATYAKALVSTFRLSIIGDASGYVDISGDKPANIDLTVEHAKKADVAEYTAKTGYADRAKVADIANKAEFALKTKIAESSYQAQSASYAETSKYSESSARATQADEALVAIKDQKDRNIRDTFDSLLQTVDILNDRDNTLQKQITTNTVNISSTQSDVKALSQRVTDNESEIEDLNNNLDLISEQTSTNTSSIETIKATNSSIKTDVANNASEIASIKEKNTSQDSNISNLQDRVSVAETNISSNDADIANLQELTSQHTEKLSNLEPYKEKVDKNIKDISELEKTTLSNVNQLINHEQRIASFETSSDVGQFATRVTEIESKNTEQDDRLTTLENETTSQSEKIKANADAIAKHEEVIGTLTGASTEVTDKLSALTDKNTEQDSRLDSLESKNTEQDKTISSIQESVSNNSTSIALNTSKNTEQDSRLDALESFKTSASSQLETNSADIQQAQADISSIKEKNTAQEKSISDLNDKTDAQASAIKANLDSINKIDTLNSTQDNRLTAVETKNDKQDSRLTALEEYNNNLVSTIQSLEEKDNAHDASLTTLSQKIDTNKSSITSNTNSINSVLNWLKTVNYGNEFYDETDITDKIYAAPVAGSLRAQIASGNFSNIHVGQKIVGKYSGTIYRVAENNGWKNIGDTILTSNHVILIVEQLQGFTQLWTGKQYLGSTDNCTAQGYAPWNADEGATSGKNVTGNYEDSYIKKIVLNKFNTQWLVKDFEDYGITVHTFRNISCSSFNNDIVSCSHTELKGAPALWSARWVDSKSDLMTEQMVFGHMEWSSSPYDTITHPHQLAIFKYKPIIQALGKRDVWLRNSASSSRACNATHRGTAATGYASLAFCVCPFFIIS